MRDQLVEKLDADGVEYERLEVVDGGLELHKDGQVHLIRMETPEETAMRVLEEEEHRRREMEQMPFTLSSPGAMGMAAAASQAKPWGGSGKYSSVHGDVKREKARAKRKRLKKHKKRGR